MSEQETEIDLIEQLDDVLDKLGATPGNLVHLHTVSQAISEIESLRAKISEWKTIDSAPCGIRILVFAAPSAHGSVMTTFTATKTYVGEVLRDPMCARLHATYWQPLPDPPK